MKEKLRLHKEAGHWVKIYSKVSKNKVLSRNGYILGFSDNLLLIQQTHDFNVDDYAILPISQIQKIRFNSADKYFDKIMRWENRTGAVGIKHTVDIDNWRSAFKSLKELGLNVIAECEAEEIDSFTIGPIAKVGKKLIHITYFDAAGHLDDEPTSINYESLTRVVFDSEYINIFSKYLRKHKAAK
ncbi:hypothetical protein LX99_04918 [Mucilaginibacter oryzae]|uniref:Uncharacterized protein n=1 Tax=Mucilaginibacter oryzae TaxID=468058 RepID=A0A316GUL5_9SPHI|nr:hypothetical protein [Mucilaginibacter oryzae]PWK67060.1 hypothetical protein LX99_04918 [Mucilaginibacter oryzae]